MIRFESVLNGRDNQVIPILLEIHCDVENPKILDCTYNSGKIWKNLNYKPLRMDINKELDLDIIGDFMNMPFKNDSFDVIVFDPPFLPTNAASKNSSLIYKETYGITGDDSYRKGDNVNDLFKPFLLEAKRVLRKNGIILAKIQDLTHNHRSHWQHVDFINKVNELEMTPCDMLIKHDPCGGNLKSSKWKNVKHLRKVHSYWIVVRNSNKCECKKMF